jgi:alpha-L-fucosidase
MNNMKYLLPLIWLLACQAPEVIPPDPVGPVPSQRQLDWHQLEYYGFIHFNMNTFSDMEWGMGNEKPEQFNPTDLDARQWARIARAAGMKGLIITAKHHDGFCLWPSAFTEHSVKNSPWRNGEGDLIRELSDACKAEGLKFGIYYSPWDRNHEAYGSQEYIAYMRNQLAELLTHYGDIFEVWFDGANGGTGFYGGANEDRKVDKKSYYDWEYTFALVRNLQPDAVIFGDAGPDVRWVGNEYGFAYETTWSTLLRDSVYAGMPEYSEKYAKGQENGTHWVPAESDVSIRPGWYYHAYEDHKVKSLSQLVDIYYKSIGQNSSLLINIPVDKRGLVHEKDEEQLLKLAQKIKDDFADNLAITANVTATNFRGKGFEPRQVLNDEPDRYWATADGVISGSIILELPKEQTVNRFLVREYIPLGQRIKSFILEAETPTGWKTIYNGTTVGAKRIIRFDSVSTRKIRFNVIDAKGPITISEIGLYHAPKLVEPPVIERNREGQISLNAAEKGLDIHYTLDGTAPTVESKLYKQPFRLEKPGKVSAVVIDPASGKISESGSRNFDVPKAKWAVNKMTEKAENAIDENRNTFWKSSDNQIVIDLGEELLLFGFTYLPPQNRYMSGVISEYLFSSSLDGTNWIELAKGEFANIHNNPVDQQIRFEPAKARFIRLSATATTDKESAAFAEVGIITVN